MQEIKSLDEPLSDIKKVENKCPVCQSDISEDKKNELIHMYEETISGNTVKINENNEIITKLNKDKSLKDANLLKLDSIKTKIYQNKHIVGVKRKTGESKKAEVNDSLNGCQSRGDQRASSEATDSPTGHQQKYRETQKRVPLCIFYFSKNLMEIKIGVWKGSFRIRKSPSLSPVA